MIVDDENWLCRPLGYLEASATANKAIADPPFGFAQGRLFGDDKQERQMQKATARAGLVSYLEVLGYGRVISLIRARVLLDGSLRKESQRSWLFILATK